MARRCIGLAFSDKKWIEFGQPLMQTLASLAPSVQVKRIRMESTLVEQGPFDLILHKINDVLQHKEEKENPLALAFVSELMAGAYAQKWTLVDPITESLTLLLHRLSMMQLLASFLAQTTTQAISQRLSIPDYRVVQDTFALVAQVDSCFSFPWILKSLMACSSPQSHHMWIVPDLAALLLLIRQNKEQQLALYFPLFVQQYIPHACTLFKVYVLGDAHFTIQRASVHLPCHTTGDAQSEPFSFNSQQMDKKVVTCCLAAKASWPDTQWIADTAQALRAYLALDLFGFDMVVHKQTNVCYIVDVNYFPSYHGVPNRFELLGEFLLSKLNAHLPDGLFQVSDKPFFV